MVSGWVLVLVLQMAAGLTSLTIEQNTKEACESNKKFIREQIERGNVIVLACISKNL